MCDRIKWWSSVIYLSTGYVISVMISKGQRLKTLWQNILQKNDGARTHTTTRWWSTTQGGTVSEVILLDLKPNQTVWSRKLQEFIPKTNWSALFEPHVLNRHCPTTQLAACSLFMDTEVCVAAFVTGAHLICMRSGQNSIYLINTNYSARWPSQWLFIMHEGAHNPN